MTTPNTPKPKNSTRGCLIYGMLVFVGLPLLLLVVGALFLVGRERSARRQLDERIADIRDRGLPVDNMTLDDYYKSLTSAQDTQAWLAILKEITSDSFDQSVDGVPIFDGAVTSPMPGPLQAWPEEEATRKFLLRWQSLHDRCAALSRKQLQEGTLPVRFPLQFDSINTLLPNTQNMRQAGRLLKLKGQVAVYDGQSTTTRRSIEALLGCSRTLGGEPFLVSQLVSIAIDGMALDLLKSAVEHDVLTEKDLQTLLPYVLARIHIGPEWRQSMVGERASLLPIFDNPSMAGDTGPPNLLGRSRDALYYLDHINAVISIPENDFDTFLAGLESQEAELAALFESGGLLQRLDTVLTGMLAPATSSAGSSFVRQASQHRLAALCIAVRLHEKRHGTLPSSLDQLSELPLDPDQMLPPGKKPFGYRIDEIGAIVWGFDSNLEASTPEEPPSTTPDAPNAEQNRVWIWRIPATTKPPPGDGNR